MKEANTYIFYSDRYKMYKIGRSSNIDGRLKTLEREYGHLELFFETDIDIELFLHKSFDSKRYRLGKSTEWFKLSKEDFILIDKFRIMDSSKQSQFVLDYKSERKLSKLIKRIKTQKITIKLAKEQLKKSEGVLDKYKKQLKNF